MAGEGRGVIRLLVELVDDLLEGYFLLDVRVLDGLALGASLAQQLPHIILETCDVDHLRDLGVPDLDFFHLLRLCHQLQWRADAVPRLPILQHHWLHLRLIVVVEARAVERAIIIDARIHIHA